VVDTSVTSRLYTTPDYGITYLFPGRHARGNMGDKLVTLQWSGL